MKINVTIYRWSTGQPVFQSPGSWTHQPYQSEQETAYEFGHVASVVGQQVMIHSYKQVIGLTTIN